MELNNINHLCFLGSAAVQFLLFIAFFVHYLKKNVHVSVVVATFVSVCWHLSIVFSFDDDVVGGLPVQVLEPIRYGIWISALLFSFEFSTGQKLEKMPKIALHGIWFLSLFLALVFGFYKGTGGNPVLSIYVNIALAILGIVAAEQLCRQINPQRLTKLLGVVVGASFAYDAWIHSYILIFNEIDLSLYQTRGLVSAFAGIMVLLGLVLFTGQEPERSKLAISRPVVLSTTSLIIAGCFFLVMSLVGFLIREYGGDWAAAIEVLIYFVALISITLALVSRRISARMRVWVNKHFFHHKYDYRTEWLRLNASLSKSNEFGTEHQQAVFAATSIFNSPGGGLWLNNAGMYAPAFLYNLHISTGRKTEPSGSPFCKVLETDWVIMPSPKEPGVSNRFQHVIPEWVNSIEGLWLVVPLLTENELMGFLVLTKPEHDESLTWEDLDLLKTVGRQLAGYIGHHDSLMRLAESREFDAFNKLTAFLMHDLKNLIAQQSYVVSGAERHKNNPEFVADAFETVKHSVNKMNDLLRKLQDSRSSDVELDVETVIKEAALQCSDRKPAPIVCIEDQGLIVKADKDRFVMMLIHLIRNAQDATDEQGNIRVVLERNGDSAVIQVTDNGIGMDATFIEKKLFKPFDSTKKGKGMGIGAFQMKDFVAHLNGCIEVDSKPGEGASFHIMLPMVNRLKRIDVA